jgi:tRNA(adenine34) deaminase
MDFNHHPAVESGLRAEEAAALMEDFFRELRVTLRDRPKWRPPEK